MWRRQYHQDISFHSSLLVINFSRITLLSSERRHHEITYMIVHTSQLARVEFRLRYSMHWNITFESDEELFQFQGNIRQLRFQLELYILPSDTERCSSTSRFSDSSAVCDMLLKSSAGCDMTLLTVDDETLRKAITSRMSTGLGLLTKLRQRVAVFTWEELHKVVHSKPCHICVKLGHSCALLDKMCSKLSSLIFWSV